VGTALEALLAASGVFAGSLIADVVFGDGIQSDDMLQAVTVAVIAAVIQFWLARRRRR
jgi:hypothetical protein